MALAFARCLLRLSEKDPRRAAQCAEMFELWLTFSAAKLACEITSDGIRENGEPHARKHYGALHVFVLLANFVRCLKVKFAELVAKLPATGWVLMPRAVCVHVDPPTSTLLIIDSG